MIQIKFKKGQIPFKKLQEMLESGLDGEEFELPEVICSNSSYYLYSFIITESPTLGRWISSRRTRVVL